MTLLKDESGVTAAEYALILAVIGVAIIVAAMSLSQAISGILTLTGDCIDSRGANC